MFLGLFVAVAARRMRKPQTAATGD
jgi:hypothetical protein